jgi:hypothetical protein
MFLISKLIFVYQKVLEKFNPSNSSLNISFKVLQKQNASEIELIMQKLTFVLNESIYKIALTFGGSLKYILFLL